MFYKNFLHFDEFLNGVLRSSTQNRGFPTEIQPKTPYFQKSLIKQAVICAILALRTGQTLPLIQEALFRPFSAASFLPLVKRGELTRLSLCPDAPRW